jgi:hypothetical protein
MAVKTEMRQVSISLQVWPKPETGQTIFNSLPVGSKTRAVSPKPRNRHPES